MPYQSSAKHIGEYSTTEYVNQMLGRWLLQRYVNSICKMRRWFQRQGA